MPEKSIEEKLAEPFDPADVRFKPQTVSANRALAVAYTDVRVVQDRLDSAAGPAHWQDEYTIDGSGSVICRLSIRLNGEWISKVDVGSLSEQPDAGDKLKAAFSDGLKRAAVKWGVGRYLYRLPMTWVDYDPVKKQIITPPQLPAFALPDSHKACGAVAANQIQGLACSLAEATSVTVEAIVNELVVKYRYDAKTPLARVTTRDARAMLQDLNEKINTVAADPPPKNDPPKSDVSKKVEPKNGTELLTRLTAFSDKLFADKRTKHPRELLDFVRAAGHKAGYPASVTEWNEPAAISLACDAAKDFVSRIPAV